MNKLHTKKDTALQENRSLQARGSVAVGTVETRG